jgi:hypothetical protein
MVKKRRSKDDLKENDVLVERLREFEKGGSQQFLTNHIV